MAVERFNKGCCARLGGGAFGMGVKEAASRFEVCVTLGGALPVSRAAGLAHSSATEARSAGLRVVLAAVRLGFLFSGGLCFLSGCRVGALMCSRLALLVWVGAWGGL